MKDAHFCSRMLTGAAGLMAMSALLMFLAGQIPAGGAMLASAVCMFLSSRGFRMAEDRKLEKEENHDEE